MHTHALADDLRPRRSLWLSRRARWSVAAGVVLLVVLVAFAVVYRLNQQPYAFDKLTRLSAVGFAGAEPGPGVRAYLDRGRAYLGHPTGGGRFDLRAVDVEQPGGKPIWAISSLTDVDTFRAARGSVVVIGRPDEAGARRITMLSSANGATFATYDVRAGDAWTVIGRYFVHYRQDTHKLVVTDVGKPARTVEFDQPEGARSWWPTDDWSGQQVATSPDGDQLDEGLTVDPHIVRALPDRGLEVVSLSTYRPVASATGIAGPEDLVYPYEEQVFVADGRAAFDLRAYDRDRFGRAQWSWTSPDPQARPTFVTVCGERRVCVGEDHAVTALDTRTGAVAFRLPVEHATHLLPAGDHVMLRRDDPGHGQQTSLVDADGHIVRSWPAKRAARLDEGSYLLLPTDTPDSGVVPWSGVQAESGATRDLGTLDVRLDSCTWSHKYLACAAPGEFVFYRVRGSTLSGLSGRL